MHKRKKKNAKWTSLELKTYISQKIETHILEENIYKSKLLKTTFPPRQYREPLKVNNSTANSTTIWTKYMSRQLSETNGPQALEKMLHRYLQIQTAVRYLFTLHKYGFHKKQVIKVKKNVKK